MASPFGTTPSDKDSREQKAGCRSSRFRFLGRRTRSRPNCASEQEAGQRLAAVGSLRPATAAPGPNRLPPTLHEAARNRAASRAYVTVRSESKKPAGPGRQRRPPLRCPGRGAPSGHEESEDPRYRVSQVAFAGSRPGPADRHPQPASLVRGRELTAAEGAKLVTHAGPNIPIPARTLLIVK